MPERTIPIGDFVTVKDLDFEGQVGTVVRPEPGVEVPAWLVDVNDEPVLIAFPSRNQALWFGAAEIEAHWQG